MSGMDERAFEQAYERLAQALDAVAPEEEAAFLTRLALLLAAGCADPAAFETALEAAARAGREGDQQDERAPPTGS